MFGIIIGVDFAYNWKTNVRFIITKGIVVFLWSQVAYTHYRYTVYENILRNCELFAIYGIAVSV